MRVHIPMHDLRRNHEEIAFGQCDSLLSLLAKFKVRLACHDVSVESAFPMMMPAALRPCFHSDFADLGLLRLEDCAPTDTCIVLQLLGRARYNLNLFHPIPQRRGATKAF